MFVEGEVLDAKRMQSGLCAPGADTARIPVRINTVPATGKLGYQHSCDPLLQILLNNLYHTPFRISFYALNHVFILQLPLALTSFLSLLPIFLSFP